MRLKYYLRGAGIGIVVTTIIFMISISLHKNDTASKNAPVDNDKSTTVSEAEKNAREADLTGTETEEADTGKTNQPEQAQSDKQDKDKPDTNKSDADKPDKSKENSENTAKDDTASEQQSSDNDTKSKDENTEKVRFEIKGGEYSDTISQKLKTAGLIDDAKAFNQFLIQKDYDNGILPGVYDIPKDATYEEIAALLTAKVE